MEHKQKIIKSEHLTMVYSDDLREAIKLEFIKVHLGKIFKQTNTLDFYVKSKKFEIDSDTNMTSNNEIYFKLRKRLINDKRFLDQSFYVLFVIESIVTY